MNLRLMGRAFALFAVLGVVVASPVRADLEGLFAGKKVIQGANVSGRGGLLFADTAQVPDLHSGSASAHLLYGSTDAYDRILVPVGARYSPIQNLEVSANVPLVREVYPDVPSDELDRKGVGVFQFGGKYKFDLPDKELPNFAIGANIGLGPLSKDIDGFGVDWNLKGIATYPVPGQGIELNGSLGLLHRARRTRRVVASATNSYDSYTPSETTVAVSLGTALAFTNRLTGIAEVSTNELAPNSGLFAFGLRGGQKIQYQALIGPGLGSGAPDFWLGGGVMVSF